MPVSPLMRAMVVAIAFTLFQVVTGLFDDGGEPLTARALGLGMNAVANFVEGLISGLGWFARLLAGLLVVTPIDHAPSVILARPEALSARSIVEQAIVATISTVLLPWLDPPRAFWRWTQSVAGARRQLRVSLIVVVWSVWLIAATMVYVAFGYLIGEILAVSLGQSSEPWSDLERMALWVVAAVLAGLIGMIAFVIGNRTAERRARLVRSVGVSAVFAGALALLVAAITICIARGVMEPGPLARVLLADNLKQFIEAPIWFAADTVGIWITFTLCFLPPVFGLVTLDTRAARAGTRSIVTTIALVLAVAFLVSTGAILIATVAESIVFGSSNRSGGTLVGRVAVLFVGFAAAAWIIGRRKAVPKPRAEWAEKEPIYAPLPDAVADAVADNAKRMG